MKLNAKQAAKHLGRNIQVQSPTILSAIAVVGVAATGYLTFKATWKAHREVSDEHLTRQFSGGDTSGGVPMTKQEIALKIWKLYIPAVATGVGTIGCIVLSHRIQARRAAAMLAAYGVLSGDFDEYKQKARELLGEKKSKEISDKAAEKKVLENPPPQGVLLEDGTSWFCDLSTMRYFKSDRQHVEKARNDLNYYLLNENYADLNEMYGYLGLDRTHVGDQLGWTQDQQVEIKFTAILMPDGAAATAFTFNPEPKPDFDSLH